ncbi:protein of unknown function [Streptomyces sp. KY75]|nr:protein of unknown function [Streptomyces sp. KY75]
MSATFGASPIPSQMMNSGISPTQGTVRSICTVASTRSSPSRESPETSASTVPITPPSTSPTATRWSDTPMAAGRVPSATRSPPARAMVPGEASTSGCRTPVALKTCQSASSSNGPTVRRSHRGTDRNRARRTDAGTIGSRSGDVRLPEAGVFSRPAAGSGGAWLMVMGAPREVVRRGDRERGHAEAPPGQDTAADPNTSGRPQGRRIRGGGPGRRQIEATHTGTSRERHNRRGGAGAKARSEATGKALRKRQQPRQHAADTTRSRSM